MFWIILLFAVGAFLLWKDIRAFLKERVAERREEERERELEEEHNAE